MSETILDTDRPDLRTAAEAACTFLQTLGRPLFIASGMPMLHDLHKHSEALRVALSTHPLPAVGPFATLQTADSATGLRPEDLCTIVGVKADGTEVELGEGPIQPRSKAVDLLRSYGFTDLDEVDSDGHYALMVIEELVSWMLRIGWQSPPVLTRPAEGTAQSFESTPGNCAA